MRKKHSFWYPAMLGFSALTISISSAYYSVYGLGALFAGAALQIMIMAGTLEFAKVLLTGFLHRFWADLPTLLRTYLAGSVVVLVIISSMGIYGYLASAYQNSSLELGSVEDRVEVLEQRKQRYLQQVQVLNEEREGLTATILSLSGGLTSNTIQYVDPQTGQLITTQSSAARNILQQQLTSTRQRESVLSSQVDALSDSLLALDDRIFSIKDESTASKNLGPLIFLAEVAQMPMDKVVNILIVTIMLVFDPLAITMIIATSVAFDTVKGQEPPSDPEPEPEPEPEVIEEPEPEPEIVEEPIIWPILFPTTPIPSPPVVAPNVYGEQLIKTSEVRKVSKIHHVGNFVHVTYNDGSVDRIPERDYERLKNQDKIIYL